MYSLVTQRMYMIPAHPKLAKEVADFNLRNKQALKDTEPARSPAYYEKSGMRSYLKMDYRDFRRGREYRYYLRLKGDKKIIGTVCLSNVMFGSVKRCNLSYKIDKDYQGMGLCSEAVGEIIHFAFNILNLHRIERQVMPRNTPSLKIMEKFNFRKEGLQVKCLEVNNKWEDHFQFALLNDKISRVQEYSC
jgi:ribosomal-protein-alanine N-acetyltransferase